MKNDLFMVIALSQKAMELAIRISKETVANAWFDYSGHCNVVRASYSPKQWRSWLDADEKNQSNSVDILNCSQANEKNLQYIVDCFEFIYAVAERKPNGTA